MNPLCLTRLKEGTLSRIRVIGSMELQDTQHSLDRSHVRDALVPLLIYSFTLLLRAGLQKNSHDAAAPRSVGGIQLLRVFRKVV